MKGFVVDERKALYGWCGGNGTLLVVARYWR